MFAMHACQNERGIVLIAVLGSSGCWPPQLLVDHLQMTTQNCTRRAQYDIYSDIRSTIRYGSMQTSFEADSPETNHDGIVPCHLIEGLVRLAMLRFNP